MKLEEIPALVAPYTMVSGEGVSFTVQTAARAALANRDRDRGFMAECGVWRGGCSLAMLLAQRVVLGSVRFPVIMFDSFEGLPRATERDGPRALAWQADVKGLDYYDNCKAPVDEVTATLARFGFVPSDYWIMKGPFTETVARVILTNTPVHMLRVDCDWFDSVKLCLDRLVPFVAEGSTVIVDDYFAWDGCARALHTFLAEHDLPYRITSLPDSSAAYFIKA